METTVDPGAAKAIELAGGPAKLAALLSEGRPPEEKVTRQVVSNWRKRGVPVAMCPAVERVLERKVTCAELQPKVFGNA